MLKDKKNENAKKDHFHAYENLDLRSYEQLLFITDHYQPSRYTFLYIKN